MRTVRFMLSRDVRAAAVGDAKVSRLMMDLAAESYSVSAVALSEDPGGAAQPVGQPRGADVELVRRAPFSPRRVGLRALRRRRSLAHAEYDEQSMQQFLESDPSDIFVAEHSYMAESFLGSHSEEEARDKLYVNTHVRESTLWRESRNPLRQADSLMIRSDEVRVARSAAKVGCLDQDEAEWYAGLGAEAQFLPITFPPTAPPAHDRSPHLLFLGSAHWEPNREAVDRLLQLWPRIRARVPAAELHLVGSGMSVERFSPVAGVRYRGFVEDLTDVLRRSAAMIAPIRRGGGVRVKFLDAAAAGLPIIGSDAAVGSLSHQLPVDGMSDDAMVDTAIDLLRDPSLRDRVAARLYEANRELWQTRVPHRAVESWLTAGRRVAGAGALG